MAKDLVKISGVEDFKDFSKRSAKAGDAFHQNFGELLIETGMNIHNRMKHSILRGRRSARGRVYEWEADLPGRSGDGGPLRVMGGWDRDEFKALQAQGKTPALRMNDNSGGHVIPIKLRASPHKASAPGDYPASDTGMLQRKVDFEPKTMPTQSGEEMKVTAGVVDLDYAVYLEEGTRFMKARPFLEPSIEEERKIMFKSLDQLLKDLDA